MSLTIDQIKAEAMKLSPEERAEYGKAVITI